MNFSFNHFNFNVRDLEKSLRFYREALGLLELSRKETADFIIVFLGDQRTGFRLELTCLKGRQEAYDLGEQEYHLALTADDIELAHRKHAEMGCICFENPEMGIYFLEDPDGYWIEIVPARSGSYMEAHTK
ncbi:VOC family protein [Oribacterium sp. oral taxon 102]|uniref:VOC family protein n=1 Tax=Oribacterium sp. oral taxon 102 TaxID=671214 RepID=UPI0015BE982C|nr:VOC family protein [Oribacterium sp. oral taxon 102]NWO21949.1 VOC family protein [Oribacterium sp. oral taxon 102]